MKNVAEGVSVLLKREEADMFLSIIKPLQVSNSISVTSEQGKKILEYFPVQRSLRSQAFNLFGLRIESRKPELKVHFFFVDPSIENEEKNRLFMS